MSRFIEKRECRRFVVPESEVRFKRRGLAGLFKKAFSQASQVMNLSKGGLAFVSEQKIGKGTKILIRLMTEDEMPLELYATVRWQGMWEGSTLRVIGVEFMPFGSDRDQNSRGCLEALKRLEEIYAER